MRLEGRVAIVTGGAKGIGRGIATVLAREGASLVLVGRDRAALETAERELETDNTPVLVCRADVSRVADVTTMVSNTLARFGRTDILINNAGVNPHRGRSVLDTTAADWDHAMAVNLRGAFLCTRAVLPEMKRCARGWIVNVCSLASRVSPDGRNCGYRASKFGLRGFTWTLAKDVRDDGIAVSAVLPGTTRSAMVADQGGNPAEWLNPMDIGEVVLFLVTRDPKVVIPEITVSPRAEIGGPFCPYS